MKKLISILILCLFTQVCFSADRKMETDLNAAIELAQKDNKLIFIKYGRDVRCGNCVHLNKLINQRAVRISDSEFVLVNLNCDDPVDSKSFRSLYGDSFKDAKTLPFVVIAKADGTLISSVSSYQNADSYNKFIMSAKSKSKK